MMQGLMGTIADKFRGDEGSARLYGLGLLASQLGAGQTPDASPALAMLDQRRAQKAFKNSMSDPGMMDMFTEQERAFLSTLPPSAAQSLIAQRVFAAPAAPIEINGQLVDPVTRQVVGDYRTPEAPGQVGRIVTGAEAAALGLDPKLSYNIEEGPEGMKASQIGGGGVNIQNNLGPNGIDFGSPGPGLVWQRDAAGQIVMDERGAPVAIPFQGGSAYQSLQEQEAEAIAAQTQQALRDSTAATAGNVVVEDIGRLTKLVQEAPWYSPAVGAGTGILENFRGSNAADAKALASTIRANIGFDRLQQMREGSPTGGALGNVTERELSDLQAVLGSLDSAQSEEQFLQNLERLNTIYGGIMEKFNAYPNAAEFGFGGQTAPPPAANPRLRYNPATGEFE